LKFSQKMLLPIIETERLFLRMYRADDLESVYRLITDENVTRFFPDYYSVNEADMLASLPRRTERWRKYGFGQLGVFDKSSGNLIGYCGLQPLDETGEIEIYYGFYKDFWGKGLATEGANAVLRFGFEHAELPGIAGVTHLENADSQKVLRRLGMKQGKDGHFYNLDAAYFSISREDYRRYDHTFYKLDFCEVE